MILFKDALIHSPQQESVKADLLIDGEKIAKIGKVDAHDARTYHHKFILPAYIDSHMHLLEYGYSLIFLDLRGARSADEVFDLLTAELSQAKKQGFLYAFNLAPERLKPTNWIPTTQELERISRDIPIFIRREDGHSVFLNKVARRWLLHDQPIEHANDHLAGRLNELAVERMQERVPAEVRQEAFLRAGGALLSYGVKAASVMIADSRSLEDVEVFQSVQSRVGIEAALFPQHQDVDEICKMRLARLGGCILIDGSIGSHTAALREPYCDAPGNNGILYFYQKELDSLVECGQGRDLQMTFHAIGDDAISQLISSYRKVLEPGNPRRHRIEHAELMPPDLIKKAAELNLILSVQPLFETTWGQEGGMYHQRLGERRRWTNPYRSILDAGILIAAGSDGPITTPDPALGIEAFLNHPIAEERISPREAVAAYTSGGAYAMHAEHRMGSVAQGLAADILVFDDDPFDTLDFHPHAVVHHGKLVAGRL